MRIIFQTSFWYKSLVLSIFSIAIVNQYTLLLNHDVSWLMQASSRMLAGGHYLNQFFENNPPLVLYLYSIPILVTKYFGITSVTSLRIFIVSIIFLTLALSTFFFKNIFTERLTRNTLLIVITFILLILPQKDFGQREHMLLIFTLPYLLLSVLRAENIAIGIPIAIFTGAYSFFGFALKPYFLVTPVLIELYLILKTRNILYWVRAETISAIALGLIYLLVLFKFHNDYLSIVMPFALRWCYLGTALPFTFLLHIAPIYYCVGVIVLSMVFQRLITQQAFAHIMTLSITGYLIAYFIQHTIYIYHYYPAFSIAILLGTYLYLNIFCRKDLFSQEMILFLTATAIILIFALTPRYWPPQVYYHLLAAVTAFSFFITASGSTSLLIKKLSFAAFIFAACFYFAMLNRYTDLYPYNLYLSICLLAAALCLSFPRTSRLPETLKVIMSWLIFFYPAFFLVTVIKVAYQFKADQLVVFKYFNDKIKNENVYVMSTNMLPVTYYTHTNYASRFSHLWMIPGMVKAPYYNLPNLQQILLKDKMFTIRLVIEDFKSSQPKFVFIDSLKAKHLFFYKTNNPHQPFKMIPFDYIKFFSESDQFRKIWDEYEYFDTLKITSGMFAVDIIKYDIYVRRN